MNKDQKTIDFIGIGAAKSGTTWLGKCLEDHPDILFSSQKSRKEISFFNSNTNWQEGEGFDLSTWDKGIDWYYTQFPDPEPGKVRGEFTVTYMIDPVACERIKKYFPKAKLLVVLRNPSDMIHSLHYFGSGSAISGISGTFEEAIEKGRILDFGLYYKHLKKYYDNFPHKNIHVTLVDDFKKDNLGTIQAIYRFLGADDSFVPESLNIRVNEAFKPRFNIIRNTLHKTLRFLNKYNKALYFRILDNDYLAKFYNKVNKVKYKYPKMSEETRAELKKFFLEDIEKLERLINKDLTVWK